MHKWSMGKCMKQSTVGISVSKAKVTRGENYVWRPDRGIILDFRLSSTFLVADKNE